MRVKIAGCVGACEAIEAEFVFGPSLCRKTTNLVTDDGDEFFVCAEHARLNSSETAR